MNERPARSRSLFSNGKSFQIYVVASDWTYRFIHTWKKRYAAPNWTYRFSHTWNDDTRIVNGENQWTNENLLYGNLVSKSRYVYNKIMFLLFLSRFSAFCLAFVSLYSRVMRLFVWWMQFCFWCSFCLVQTNLCDETEPPQHLKQ